MPNAAPILPRSSAPEIDLICRCAGAAISGAEIEGITELIERSIDWQQLISAADRSKVLPLIYSSLHRAGGNTVPAAVMAVLHAHALTTTQNNLALLTELKRVMENLKSAGVVVVPYKGLALSAVYGSLAIREAGDIDLLVRREDVLTVAARLRELGYQPDSPRTLDDERALLKSTYDYHLPFEQAQSGIVIEPHWGLMPRFFSPALDDFVADCWKRLGEQDLFGTATPALDPADLPIVLATHAGKHLWARLNWICDLAAVARQNKTDWGLCWARAQAIGQSRHLAIGWRLASDFLGVAIPLSIKANVLSDGAAKSVAERVKRKFYRETKVAEQGAGFRHWMILKSMEKTRDRVNWVWGQMKAKWKS